MILLSEEDYLGILGFIKPLESRNNSFILNIKLAENRIIQSTNLEDLSTAIIVVIFTKQKGISVCLCYVRDIFTIEQFLLFFKFLLIEVNFNDFRTLIPCSNEKQRIIIVNGQDTGDISFGNLCLNNRLSHLLVNWPDF